MSSDQQPLRSALKKSGGGGGSAAPAAAASDDTAAATSSVVVVPKKRVSAASSASAAAAAAAADASTAAASAARDARIRAAAEEKATQLHAHRAASEQWASWVTRVQTLLLGPPTSPVVTASALSRAALVLRPGEMDEVVEERAAAKQCGWPLCERESGAVAGGKAARATGASAPPIPSPAAAAITAAGAHRALHLSLKSQRVYDVSQSSETCSAACALRLEEYKKSLSDEPFYLRKMMQPRPAAAAAAASAAPNANANAPAATAPTNQTPLQQQPDAQSSLVAPQSQQPAESKEPSPEPHDDRAITQLHIVEKSAGRTLPPHQPPSAATAARAATAIEGYEPTTAAATIAAAQRVAAPATAAARKPETAAEAVAAPSASVSAAASSAPTADAAAAAAAAAAAPRSVSFAADTAAPAASAPPSAEREYLEFVDLPSALVPNAAAAAVSSTLPVGSSAPFAVLSRSEFEALSPSARMDYMAHVALREQAMLNANRQANQDQLQLAAEAEAQAAASPPDAEKKIKRRKSAGKAQQTSGEAQAETNGAVPAATASPARDPASVSRSIPGLSPATQSVLLPQTAPLMRAPLSTPASAASLALLADDPDADPIISPEEMRASVSAVRAAAATGALLSPFAALIQSLMRWSNGRTQQWIQTGRVSAQDAGSRSKVTAFLTLLTQHLPRVLAALHIRAVVSRELSELASSFAFDSGAVPSLTPAQWTLLCLAMLKAVGERLARAEQPGGRLKGHQHSWAGLQRISALAGQRAEPAVEKAQREAVEAQTAATLAAASAVTAPSSSAAGSAAASAPRPKAASSATCAECMSTTSSALLAAIQTLLASIGFSIEQMDSLYQTLADGGWMQPA